MADWPVALKRLAAVEVEANTSNQHEFNATILRRGLGISETRVGGALTIAFYTRDGEEPVIEDTTYTLYDSRENQPRRSAEYRLYYASPVVGRLARQGDLLVIYQAEGDALQAIIARPGTRAEKDLTAALLGGARSSELRRFVVVEAPVATPESGGELAATLAVVPSPLIVKDLGALVAESAALESATKKGEVPNAKDMAAAAQAIVNRMGGNEMSPDELLNAALNAETALYSEIEGRVGAHLLDSLVESGELTFPAVIKFAMKYHQSRKSRRGQSLQNHFAILLHREGIPHSAQKTTEGTEKPDFIVPGIDEYRDPSFPAARLRMVACKSRTRERWDQVLNEAKRIEDKFLLTVDEDLTDDVIQKMANNRIHLFLPEAVLRAHYRTSLKRHLLGNVSGLIDRLREVINPR
jgi:hypothetical protein